MCAGELEEWVSQRTDRRAMAEFKCRPLCNLQIQVLSLCAQDGNPSNMAGIPIKSNDLLPPTAIEARQTVHPVDLAGDPANCQFPHFYVFEGVWAQIVLSIHTGTKLTRAQG